MSAGSARHMSTGQARRMTTGQVRRRGPALWWWARLAALAVSSALVTCVALAVSPALAAGAALTVSPVLTLSPALAIALLAVGPRPALGAAVTGATPVAAAVPTPVATPAALATSAPATATAAGVPRHAAAGTRAGGPPLSPGEVKAAQRRLVELGYWAGSAARPWDESWRHALIAFQKVEWRKPTGRLTRAEWDEMARAAPPAPRETGPAHIEVDLARQVLFMVDDAGAASHVLPISTGSGRPFRAPGWQGVAETPCGHFTVFSRGYGWHKSQLGEMFNPLYLVGGIAIHGSLDVPPKPVSHGCIRIPMYAARLLPRLVPREMPVVVYGCKDELPPTAAVVTKP